MWDGDVQERRLGNRFGGNDLKEEGVMGRRVRFVEKGNFERCCLDCWFSLFSRTVGDPNSLQG